MLLYTYATQRPIGARARSLHVDTPAHVYTLPAAGSLSYARVGLYTTVHARAAYTWAHPPTSAPYTAVRLITSARAPVVILQSHQEGGLESCTYDSAFRVIKISVDDVDSELERRYIRDANRMLDNCVREVQVSRFQDDSATQGNHRSRVKPSRLELFEVFVPPFLLEKLRSSINRVFSERRNGRENGM